jgi:hypothetical protein
MPGRTSLLVAAALECTKDIASNQYDRVATHGGLAVREPRGLHNLALGVSPQRQLLIDIWQDAGWAFKESFRLAAARRHECCAINQGEKQLAVVSPGHAISLLKPAWAPPQVNLSGSDRHVLTEFEYRSVLRTTTCVELEQQWVGDFNNAVGLDTILTSVNGPQVQSQAEQDKGNKGDLEAPPRPAKCDERGDCKRFSRSLVNYGDICINHICRYLRSRHNNVAGSGNDMLAVWQLTVETTEGFAMQRFLTAHCLYGPYRVIAWRATTTVDGGALKFVDDGVPDFILMFPLLHEMGVNFDDAVSIQLCSCSFQCTHWDEFAVYGVDATFDGTKFQTVSRSSWYRDTDLAVAKLRRIFVDKAKAVAKCTGVARRVRLRGKTNVFAKRLQLARTTKQHAKAAGAKVALKSLPLSVGPVPDPDPTSWMDLLLEAEAKIDAHKSAMGHKCKTSIKPKTADGEELLLRPRFTYRF